MLAIITTHPIQYQVPLWQKLAENKKIEFEVWYLTDFGLSESYDLQFGKSFAWDLPSLEGYNYRFLKVNKGAAPNLGFKGIRLEQSLKRLFLENNITHIYINGWQVQAYWQVLWQAHRSKIKVIFKGESNDLKPEKWWFWPIKKQLLNLFFSKIDYFLYIGSANKRLYKKYGINDGKLFEGFYCVDNQRFLESSQQFKLQKKTLRTLWGVPENSFCFLFAGKFIDKKRPLDIIKAAQQLNNKNLFLLFVGSGELYNEIINNCNVVFNNGKIVSPINKNEVNASIVGFLNQTEIPKAYAVSDCLILPSNFNETWGLVVNEAMACGIPAIVSNQCGSAEDLALPINENLVFECGKVQSIAASMDYIINNKLDEITILKHISYYSYQSTLESLKKIIKS